MQDLVQQRCFNHAFREAVARCPQCRQYYCRECITEHDDRAICAACLKKLLQPSPVKRRRLVGFVRIAQCLLGILMAWLFFYWLGRGLLSLPTSFHEGTVWQTE
jgi:hypothetical protein